jgi:hypothetical protein
MSEADQRRLLDTLNGYNAEHYAARADNSNLAARIASYEMAFSMQRHAPEAVDLGRETAETQSLYGLDDDRTRDFGRRCLLARGSSSAASASSSSTPAARTTTATGTRTATSSRTTPSTPAAPTSRSPGC